MTRPTSDPQLDLPWLVLRAATELVEQIQESVAESGFDDVRPAHGFAFVRIAQGDATVMELASHLGTTKQAASQLVEQLVARGYVTREPHPLDGRARVLRLTERGTACTRAAEDGMRQLAATWRQRLGRSTYATLHTALLGATTPGAVRPTW